MWILGHTQNNPVVIFAREIENRCVCVCLNTYAYIYISTGICIGFDDGDTQAIGEGQCCAHAGFRHGNMHRKILV